MFIHFREKERKGEWERETSISCLRYHSEQGLNLQPVGVQEDASTNWATQPGPPLLLLFIKIYLFLERWMDREGEKRQWVTSGAQVCNPGVCSDWKSDWQPFTLWRDTQPMEPHWSGPPFFTWKNHWETGN